MFFLRTTPGVIIHDTARSQDLIGDNDLEFVTVYVGLKQIQLHRAFALLFRPGTNEQEAKASTPRLGFPLSLEVREVIIDGIPTLAILDHPFEFHEALKGTLMLISIPDASSALTMSSLKNVLSIRTSMITPGKAVCA